MDNGVAAAASQPSRPYDGERPTTEATTAFRMIRPNEKKRQHILSQVNTHDIINDILLYIYY